MDPVENKEGVGTVAPAVEEEEAGTEVAAVEDLTGESDTPVPAAAGEGEEILEVDDQGVPFKNRFEQSQRILEKTQQDNESLFEAVKELTGKLPDAQTPEAVDTELDAIAAKYDVDPEVLRELDKRNERRLDEKLATFGSEDIGPREAVLVDRQNEESMQRIIGGDEYAGFDAPLKATLLSDAREILRNTDPGTKALADTPARALRNAMAEHMPEIRAAERKAARREAGKNREILGDAASGTSITLPGGDTMNVGEDEKRAITWLNKKLPKNRQIDMTKLAKAKKDYKARSELPLPSRRPRS